MSSSEPTDAELERAIASVPGVDAATVERVAETGRSRLRIRLASSQDAQMVSWAVATTLRERFGIELDPEDIRARVEAGAGDGDDESGVTQLTVDTLLDERVSVATPPASAAEATGARNPLAPRASIQNLDTRIDVSEVVVSATLRHGAREASADATSVPTQQGVLRAVAEATVGALVRLTDRALVASVDRVAVSVSGEPAIATVVVSVVGARGEDTLLGASLVRGDPQLAVMRATLDALNRRVEQLLAPSAQRVAS